MVQHGAGRTGGGLDDVVAGRAHCNRFILKIDLRNNCLRTKKMLLSLSSIKFALTEELQIKVLLVDYLLCKDLAGYHKIYSISIFFFNSIFSIQRF